MLATLRALSPPSPCPPMRAITEKDQLPVVGRTLFSLPPLLKKFSADLPHQSTSLNEESVRAIPLLPSLFFHGRVRIDETLLDVVNPGGRSGEPDLLLPPPPSFRSD